MDIREIGQAGAAQAKGASYTTGMVHKTRQAGTGQLVQACGMGRRQLAYLYPTDAQLTCKRCLGAP
jgi:hypothetical protein